MCIWVAMVEQRCGMDGRMATPRKGRFTRIKWVNQDHGSGMDYDDRPGRLPLDRPGLPPTYSCIDLSKDCTGTARVGGRPSQRHGWPGARIR